MNRNLLAGIAFAAALGFAGGCAHDDHAQYHPAPPAGGGFAPERIARMEAVVQADIARGRIPGAVLVLMRNGEVVLNKAYGMQDPAKGTPMQPDSIFRLYSMTKPIVSVAAMMLVEEGRLFLSDPVSKHIPELKGLKVGVESKDAAGKAVLNMVPSQREMTVHDLLRHTSGFTYGVFGKSMVKDLYTSNKVDASDHTNAELAKKLSGVPLHYQPGTTWEYGRSTDVLGHVIERVSGMPLDRFLDEKIVKPLGMKDTAFFVEPGKHARLAQAFAKDPDSGAAINLLNVKEKPVYLAGGQGMVGTGSDYLRFAQMLLNGGHLDGVRILSRKTVEYMASDHLGSIRGPSAGYGFGLGFAVRTSTGVAPVPGSVGEYNWAGLGGTAFWIDPRERLVAIWMMQAPNQRTHYRELYRDMVYGALIR